jgi:AraC-like DNA-binding protein
LFDMLIPPAEWEIRGARLENGLMRHLSGKSEAMKLLRGYIRSLERSGLTAFGNDRTIVRRHIIDLIVLAATPHRPLGESHLSAVAAAHLHAALDHIASQFSNTELSLSKIARNMRISTRYLQRLLKTSGTSFTAHVTELRLNHAFALLTAQGKGDVRICDIALQAGLPHKVKAMSVFAISHCRLAFPIFRTSTGSSVRGLAIRQRAFVRTNRRCAR